jgi:glycolate oxidase
MDSRSVVVKELLSIFGERVLTEKNELLLYSYDATGAEFLPWAVVFPESSAEVAQIMGIACEYQVPVVPRGAGSGFTGGSLPVEGGIVLSTERMNRVLEIDRENLTAWVEPGVVTGEFQKRVEAVGLFYPPDPASLAFCTLGGNVAENAGGPRAVKYGVTKDYVLGLEAVLPNGDVITTGRKVVKDVVGYNFTALLVGSEGTLAVITRILLRLMPLPLGRSTLLASFHNRRDAGKTVSEILARGVIPSTLEFIDRSALEAVAKHAEVKVEPGIEAVLLIETDGPNSGEEMELCCKVVDEKGGAFEIAHSEDEREHLWQARRAISPSLVHVSPTKVNEDVVVPRSLLADALEAISRIEERYGLPIICFGHAGDGNIHVNIMTDKEDSDAWNRAQKAVDELFDLVVGLGGSISGEHGVGTTKAKYVGMQLSNQVLELQRGIKRVFDPKNILNPGKMGL